MEWTTGRAVNTVSTKALKKAWSMGKKSEGEGKDGQKAECKIYLKGRLERDTAFICHQANYTTVLLFNFSGTA